MPHQKPAETKTLVRETECDIGMEMKKPKKQSNNPTTQKCDTAKSHEKRNKHVCNYIKIPARQHGRSDA